MLRCAGALVRSIERDDRLDKGIVTLLVVAQERMLAVLTPPDSAAQQPLTLALLQVGLLLHSCQSIYGKKTLCNKLLLLSIQRAMINILPSAGAQPCSWLSAARLVRTLLCSSQFHSQHEKLCTVGAGGGEGAVPCQLCASFERAVADGYSRALTGTWSGEHGGSPGHASGQLCVP